MIYFLKDYLVSDFPFFLIFFLVALLVDDSSQSKFPKLLEDNYEMNFMVNTSSLCWLIVLERSHNVN